MHGYRMRGGLCHALSIINSYANVYQMFTDPEVYQFMWTIHPSLRDNNIYSNLLEDYLPELARIPWARTNSSLSGKTLFQNDNLKSQYHDYTKWSSGPLYTDLVKLVDPEWFGATGIFDPVSIKKLNFNIKNSTQRVGRINDIWLWLAGFRNFIM